jgi:protein TonB
MQAHDVAVRDEPRAAARRVVALAASLAVHLAILLLLFRESATPLPPPPEQPVSVRLIDDARGRAAGQPTRVAFPRVPSAAHARIENAPRLGPARLAKSNTVKRPQPSPAIALTVEPTQVPPPALPKADTALEQRTSDTATLATGTSATPGAAGSGANGTDAAGSMRRIVFTHRVEPALPPAYRRDPKDTYVILAVRIDRWGAPRDLRMVRSSGSSELDFAAREAARKSRYAPHMKNGKAVAFWALIPYEFGKPTIDLERALAEGGFEHT